LSTAVAIAGSFNHQDDHPYPSSLGGFEAQRIVAVGKDPLPAVFTYDDDIAPQPVEAAFEDDGWQAPPPAAPPTYTFVLWGEDELPAALEEGQWLELDARQPSVAALQPWSDDDAVPQLPVDEEAWIAWKPLAERIQAAAFLSDDEIVQQPAAALDEEYWLDLRHDQEALLVTSWPPKGGSGGPPFAAGVYEDDSWQPWLLTTKQAPQALYLPDQNEDYKPPAPYSAPVAAGSTRAVHTTVIFRWQQVDDLPLQGQALDEGGWVAEAPPAGRVVAPAYWDAGELVGPQPAPIVDEDAWQSELMSARAAAAHSLTPWAGAEDGYELGRKTVFGRKGKYRPGAIEFRQVTKPQPTPKQQTPAQTAFAYEVEPVELIFFGFESDVSASLSITTGTVFLAGADASYNATFNHIGRAWPIGVEGGAKVSASLSGVAEGSDFDVDHQAEAYADLWTDRDFSADEATAIIGDLTKR
jgi:hypothetical protein